MRPDAALLPVRFGHVVNAFTVPVDVAIKRGYLSDAGVCFELTAYANGSAVSRALEEGEVDMGAGGHLQALVSVLSGARQVFIGPLGFEQAPGYLPVALLASEGNGSGPSLEGKRVGVSAKGAISELQLRVFMAAQGADFGSLELVPMRFNEMGAALASGAVSAVSAPEPFASALAASGAGDIVDRGSLSSALEPGERAMVTGLVTTSDYLAREASIARKVREALARASKDLAGDPGLATKSVLRAGRLQGEAPRGMHVPMFGTGFGPSDLQRAFDLAFEHGLVTKRVGAESVVLQVG